MRSLRDCRASLFSVPVGDEEATRSKLTNLSTVMLSGVFVLAGGLALYFSGVNSVKAHVQWSAFLAQLGALLMATGLITIAWNLFGRRAFASEVLAKARVGTDVVASGLERVTDQYLEDVEWGELFRDVGRLDIVVAYANTWRNTHRSRLEATARRRGARIRVVLPDPSHDPTISLLAERFDMPPATLRSRIHEAIRDFRALRRPGGATVDVRVRRGDVVFSCYRFDSRAVLTLYSHARIRRTRVPTFVVADGSLFKFVYEEVTALIEQSSPAPEVP